MKHICHLSNGEAVFEDINGELLVEKEFLYLVEPTPEEMKEIHKIIGHHVKSSGR